MSVDYRVSVAPGKVQMGGGGGGVHALKVEQDRFQPMLRLEIIAGNI